MQLSCCYLDKLDAAGCLLNAPFLIPAQKTATEYTIHQSSETPVVLLLSLIQEVDVPAAQPPFQQQHVELH